MSVRAYAIKKIERNDAPSFNLWHDEVITDWLQENTSFYSELGDEATGIAEVSIEDLNRMIAEVGGKIEPDSLGALAVDIADAKKRGDEYIQYECF
jgi:hypothetical protein